LFPGRGKFRKLLCLLLFKNRKFLNFRREGRRNLHQLVQLLPDNLNDFAAVPVEIAVVGQLPTETGRIVLTKHQPQPLFATFNVSESQLLPQNSPLPVQLRLLRA